MLTGKDKERFIELREEYEELQKTFRSLSEDFVKARNEFLIRQSNKLRIHNSMIRLHATIINERYERHTDLGYCSTQILKHTDDIDEVAVALRQEGDKE